MKLYGKVIKTPRDYSVSQWPFQGYIYNQEGTLINSFAVGMTEADCFAMMRSIAQRIRNHEFIGDLGLVEL